MKKKIVLSLLLALCVAFGSATMGVAGAMTVDLYSIESKIINETVDQTIIKKETKGIFEDRSGLVTQAKLKENYGEVIDNDGIEQSDHIIIQREVMRSGDYNKSDTWDDPKGYLTLYTAAYHKSNYNANYREYTINGLAQYKKNFKIKNDDFLALTFNDNAAYLGNGSGETEGNELNSIPLSFFDRNGAYIKFLYSKDLISAQLSYSVLAEKGKAISIQTHYVHDPNLLYTNLSISISYGIGISVSGGNYDIFSAETLTFIALE